MNDWFSMNDEAIEKATSLGLVSAGTYDATLIECETHISNTSGLHGFKMTFVIDLEDPTTKMIQSFKIVDYWMTQSKEQGKAPSIAWKLSQLMKSIDVDVSQKQLMEQDPKKFMEAIRNLAMHIKDEVLKSRIKNLIFKIGVGRETYVGNDKNIEKNTFKSFVKLDNNSNTTPNYNKNTNFNNSSSNDVPF